MPFSFWVEDFVVLASLESFVGVGRRVLGDGEDVSVGAVDCWALRAKARGPVPVAVGVCKTEEAGGRKGESGRMH